MACLKHVTLREGAEHKFSLSLWFLLREFHISAICRMARVEASMLAHCVGPRLVTVDDSFILAGVLSPLYVLLALVRVLGVADIIEVCKRIGLHASAKSSRCLRTTS